MDRQCPKIIDDESTCSRLETLPIELQQIILKKLDFSSSIRCKLLSKTFSETMISDTDELAKDAIVFFKFENSLYYVSLDSSLPKRVHVPFVLCNSYFIGSCNGYLCVSTSGSPSDPYDHVTIVFNPLMPQAFIVLPSTSRESSWSSGFGFNPNTNEHKVVRIHYEREGFYTRQCVEILTLGSNHWRTLDAPSGIYVRSRMNNAKSVYLNGWMYWIGQFQARKIVQYVVLGLSLDNEEFKKVSIQDSGIVLQDCELYLLRVKGKLALLVISKSMDKDELQIWIMEDHGEIPVSVSVSVSAWRRSTEYTIDGFKAKVRRELRINEIENLTPYDVIWLRNEKLWMEFTGGVLCYSFEEESFVHCGFEVPLGFEGGNQHVFEAILHNGSIHDVENLVEAAGYK